MHKIAAKILRKYFFRAGFTHWGYLQGIWGEVRRNCREVIEAWHALLWSRDIIVETVHSHKSAAPWLNVRRDKVTRNFLNTPVVTSVTVDVTIVTMSRDGWHLGGETGHIPGHPDLATTDWWEPNEGWQISPELIWVWCKMQSSTSS